ncbi:MAG: putative Ig domain-containing protein [Kangiellaceae bacterium]|nr:putative Ig domain-containing protein [Kangiellaceae bacterium]
MTLDPATGRVSWTPTPLQLGFHSFQMSVTDNSGLSDSETINVVVETVDDAPRIMSSPVLTAKVDEAYVYDVEAKDPDSGDTITYSLSQYPDNMSINPGNGVISWTPTLPQAGEQSVTVVVTDEDGLTDTQAFVITVDADNFPPVITSSPVTEAFVRTAYTYAVTATDDQASQLSFVLNVSSTNMSIDPQSGLISWTPDASQLGDNAVTIEVSDETGLQSYQSYVINVGPEPDSDGDGVVNSEDVYPDDPNRSQLESVTSLQVSQDNQELVVRWTDISNGTAIFGYHLEKSVLGQGFQRVYSVNLEGISNPTIEYRDQDVTNRSAYQYRVVSFSLSTDPGGAQFESVPGNQIDLFVAYNIDAISDLAVTVVDQQAVLNWNSNNADEYVVYRGQEGTGAQPIAVVTENTFTDTYTVENNQYFYQIANRKNFTNPIDSQTFDVDGPLSSEVNYYHALKLGIEIPNSTKLAPTEFEILHATAETISVEISHQNAEGPIRVTLTNGAEVITRENITKSVQVDLPVADAVWNVSSEVNSNGVVQYANANLTIRADSTAPQLTINGAVNIDSNEATYSFSGTVTDDNGVKQLVVSSSQLEAQEFTALLDGDNFTVEVPLSVGENVFTFVASDIAGNEISDSRQVNKEDLLTPQLEITSHSHNQTVKSQFIDLIGRVQSELPIKDIQIKLGELSTELTANQDGSYGFTFANLQLAEGQNNLTVTAQAAQGSDSVDLTIIYEIEQDVVPALLEISSPLPGMSVSDPDFVVSGKVQGSTLSTLTVNGVPVHLVQTGTNSQAFNYLASFAANTNSILLEFVGTQSGDEVIRESVTYYLDSSAPVIAITTPLQLNSALNEVTQNPFKIEGTVTDDNISALMINEQQVSLVPGEGVNEYQFSADLQLENGVELDVELKAQDMSGNITTEAVRLISNVTAELDLIAPTGNKEFIITDTNFNLKVLARVTGLQGGETVRAFVDGANQVPLAITESLVSGEVLFTASSGSHEIKVEIVASDGQVISSTSREFSLIDPADIPLEMTRTEPANGEQYAEPNGFIGLYFSKAIDASLLSVEVYETASGKTYIKEDEPGANMFEAKGYQLKEVSRSNELVSGGLSAVPGDSMYAYYLDRDLAYGANVIVKVTYDGEEFYRFAYQVRGLPTFVSGAVYDQLDQPVAGVKVTLQDRETFTTRDGSYAFGYGDSAEDQLSPGVHVLTVNPGFDNSKFGVVHKHINIEAYRRNQLRLIKTPVIDTQNPFVPVQSGTVLNLIGGELQFDMTNATMTFPDGNTSGNLQMSFLEINDTVGEATRAAIPFWVYGSQPSGIAVNGQVSLRMKLPKVYNSYDYVPDNGKLMILVGRPSNSNAVVPIGVGEVDGIYLNSVGNLQLENLDYIGFAFTEEKNQEKLRDYANGEISLQLLIAYLQQ